MNVDQLVKLLEANGESSLQFVFPSGRYVPSHFHITEVGRVEKKFIDCGGTRREATSCLLQVWTAHDTDHRLVASKLAKIFRLAEPILGSFDLPVEIEYGDEVAAQYSLAEARLGDGVITFVLQGKQTACLALDKCGVGECGSTNCCG